MKKHLSGEKIVLKTGLNKIAIFLLLIFFSLESFPQIPINGFCKLNSYKFSAGYSRLFAFNFNNDSYTDLLFYNPLQKKISLAAGEKGEKLERERKLDFRFHLSNIKPVREQNNQIKKYIFTSRKNLTAGFCEFASNGNPKITHQIQFNSYPQNIGVSNINADPEPEILVSGASFEGMSILNQDNKKFNEVKVVSKGSYPEAIFADISNDGFPDISAFNLLNQSVDFYYNDGRGNFKLTRKIQLEQKLKGLRTFDMNFDSYDDLIFSSGSKLKIIYGDFSSSYSKHIEFETKYFPDDFIIGDFNKDGLMDFAYLNIDASLVSILFGKDEFSCYHEIPLLSKKGMTNLIPFYSKFFDGLAVLCDDGTLLTNSRISGLGSELNISLSINPVNVNYFDAGGNGINDLFWLENFDRSLKLVVRSVDGIPSTYYKIMLRANHTQVEAVNFSRDATTFFCYTEDKKLVEVITVNFRSGKITEDEFYAARPISQLKAVQGENKKIAVSSNHRNNLSIEFFELTERWELFSEQNISQNVKDFYLSSLNGIRIFFWKQDADSIKLFKKSFLPEEQKAEMLVKSKMTDVESILTIADDFKNLEKESVISFVESNEKHYILAAYDSELNIFKRDGLNKHLIIKKRNQLFSGEVRKNGTRRLTAFNHDDDSIYRLNITNKGKKISWIKLVDGVQAEKYFIKNLTVNDYHTVFINLKTGTISIKQI